MHALDKRGLWEYVLSVCVSLQIYIYHQSFLSFSVCLYSSQHVCVWFTATLAQSWPSVITRHPANPPLSPMQASEWLAGSEKHSLSPT